MANAKNLFKDIEIEQSGIVSIPNSKIKELDGLTVKDAVEQGLIEDLNPEAMLVPHDEYERFYFVFDGVGCPVSDAAVEELADAKDLLKSIAGMVFRTGVSTIEGAGFGKPWVRLSKSGELRLNADKALGVKAEPMKGRDGRK